MSYTNRFLKEYYNDVITMDSLTPILSNLTNPYEKKQVPFILKKLTRYNNLQDKDAIVKFIEVLKRYNFTNDSIVFIYLKQRFGSSIIDPMLTKYNSDMPDNIKAFLTK